MCQHKTQNMSLEVDRSKRENDKRNNSDNDFLKAHNKKKSKLYRIVHTLTIHVAIT